MLMRMSQPIFMRMLSMLTMIVAMRSPGMNYFRQLALAGQHIDLRRIDPAPVDSPQLQPRIQIKRRDSILHNIERHAGIHQRAQKHISTYAGEAIQIADLHCARSLAGLTPAPASLISEAGSKAFIDPDR